MKEKLRDLKPKLNLCGPLADALIRGLEKRFDRLLNDDFHLLATISHPKFKDMDLFDDPGTSVKAKELFIRELSKVIPKENEENEDTENVNDSKDECDGFFSRKKKKKLQESPTEMMERYIRTEDLSDSQILNAFPFVKAVYEKFNTTWNYIRCSMFP